MEKNELGDGLLDLARQWRSEQLGQEQPDTDLLHHVEKWAQLMANERALYRKQLGSDDLTGTPTDRVRLLTHVYSEWLDSKDEEIADMPTKAEVYGGVATLLGLMESEAWGKCACQEADASFVEAYTQALADVAYNIIEREMLWHLADDPRVDVVQKASREER